MNTGSGIRILVAGGGLAGITAALACADRGAQVVLIEGRPKLGGLTHSFNRDGLEVDNGQHVFLRCCIAYRRLLDRLGVSGLVTVQDRLEFTVRAPALAEPASLRRTGLPAPLHLAGALLGYTALRPTDRLRVIRASMALRGLDLRDPELDTVSFGQWLYQHGQNDRTIAAMWDLFTVATLNVPAAEASLALATKVFQTGLFEKADAGDIGWSDVPLQRLHGDAALTALTAAGVDVRVDVKVRTLEQQGQSWTIGLRDETELSADGVVLALPPAAAEQLMPVDAVDLPQGWSAKLGSSPIVNVHLVFDRHVMDEPFFAAIDSPVQWVFDRTAPSGLRRGQYLAVSLSAADAALAMTTAQLRTLILPAISELLPRARGAELVDFFVSREREATFRPAPGTAQLRPPAATNLTGLALAGSWTDTGWPATMESAVLSGEAAAEALLTGTELSTRKGAVAV